MVRHIQAFKVSRLKKTSDLLVDGLFFQSFNFETSYMPKDLSYRKYVLVLIEALCSGGNGNGNGEHKGWLIGQKTLLKQAVNG